MIQYCEECGKPLKRKEREKLRFHIPNDPRLGGGGHISKYFCKNGKRCRKTTEEENDGCSKDEREIPLVENSFNEDGTLKEGTCINCAGCNRTEQSKKRKMGDELTCEEWRSEKEINILIDKDLIFKVWELIPNDAADFISLISHKKAVKKIYEKVIEQLKQIEIDLEIKMPYTIKKWQSYLETI